MRPGGSSLTFGELFAGDFDDLFADDFDDLFAGDFDDLFDGDFDDLFEPRIDSSSLSLRTWSPRPEEPWLPW